MQVGRAELQGAIRSWLDEKRDDLFYAPIMRQLKKMDALLIKRGMPLGGIHKTLLYRISTTERWRNLRFVEPGDRLDKERFPFGQFVFLENSYEQNLLLIYRVCVASARGEGEGAARGRRSAARERRGESRRGAR